MARRAAVAKFKEYNQHQIMLMPPSLDEKVPEGHLGRCISTIVDELDVREIEEGYSEIGCRAYHPRMLIKLLLYGYSIGIRSSRRGYRRKPGKTWYSCGWRGCRSRISGP
jgi:transposase